MRTAGLAMVALLSIGCGGGTPIASPSSEAPSTAPTSGATPEPTVVEPTADLAHPVGIIAMGHSALTGEGTGGVFEAVPSNSYATGTNPEVNSIYLRLVAVVPETEGHVRNVAVGGAPASGLAQQARTALSSEPVPLLAIVHTVDNDIRCDHENVGAVGESLASALGIIRDASPNTVILVVGQPGRPSVDFVEAVVAADPSQKANLTWDDACTFYTADGNINPPGFDNLTAAIDAYEAETARVCGLVAGCFTDGGVRRTWVDKLEYYAPDFAHFNIEGQAAEAEQLWPVVEEILGL